MQVYTVNTVQCSTTRTASMLGACLTSPSCQVFHILRLNLAGSQNVRKVPRLHGRKADGDVFFSNFKYDFMLVNYVIVTLTYWWISPTHILPTKSQKAVRARGKGKILQAYIQLCCRAKSFFAWKWPYFLEFFGQQHVIFMIHFYFKPYFNDLQFYFLEGNGRNQARGHNLVPLRYWHCLIGLGQFAFQTPVLDYITTLLALIWALGPLAPTIRAAQKKAAQILDTPLDTHTVGQTHFWTHL
jgi:hypothetical protein